MTTIRCGRVIGEVYRNSLGLVLMASRRPLKNVCLPTMEVLAQGFQITLAQLVSRLDRK
jgi:hypothetical protein